MRVVTETFELMVDGNPVAVKATPFQTLATETRYRVSINNSPVLIFGYNENLHRMTVIEKGRAADQIPAKIEETIGKQLYNRLAAAA